MIITLRGRRGCKVGREEGKGQWKGVQGCNRRRGLTQMVLKMEIIVGDINAKG